MNKVKSIFKTSKKKVFIAYIVCGDPDLNTTLSLMKTLAESGVDLIELGMPFTDPMADGPAIQESSLRALNSGQNMNITLDMVSRFRFLVMGLALAGLAVDRAFIGSGRSVRHPVQPADQSPALARR